MKSSICSNKVHRKNIFNIIWAIKFASLKYYIEKMFQYKMEYNIFIRKSRSQNKSFKKSIKILSKMYKMEHNFILIPKILIYKE